MNKKRLGVALCGSYCTYGKLFPAPEGLAEEYELVPIMSDTAAETDIVSAEPLGPALPMDALLIAPCTGNTMAKLAHGISDSSVTMAAKAHLRNDKPVIVAFSTNDGLSGSLKNIAELLNRKNYYFVPFRQDSPDAKPSSLASDFSLIPQTVAEALSGHQLQPLVLGPD